MTAEFGRTPRAGRSYQYALCTSPGLAEYDTAYLIYFRPDYTRGLVVAGVVGSEVGAISGDEDIAVLSNELAKQIVRCPLPPKP